jgi:hypothetical protein
MTDSIQGARDLIAARITEIHSEEQRLRAALTELGGEAAPARRPRKAGAPKRKARKRARRGQRREEVLAAVKKMPGASAADLGREVGISTNQAYGLVRRLLKDSQLKSRARVTG